MKWKHNVVYAHRRGRVKANCTGKGCGWQTRWLADREEVRRLAREHNKLVEKERTKAGR